MQTRLQDDRLAQLAPESVEQIENPVLKRVARKLLTDQALGAEVLNIGNSRFPDAQDDD